MTTDIHILWTRVEDARRELNRRERAHEDALSIEQANKRNAEATEALKAAASMQLRNRAYVYGIAPASSDRSYRVVMAWYDGSPHPWVTWAIDDEGNAFWGHYHTRPDVAFADFKERIA